LIADGLTGVLKRSSPGTHLFALPEKFAMEALIGVLIILAVIYLINAVVARLMLGD